MSLRNFSSIKERRDHLSKELKKDLTVLEFKEFENNPDVHCENLIGGAVVPLGVAGPLVYKNGKKIYLPLATTEGALVASISRGSKAISQSGGVEVESFLHGQMRGPVFRTVSITSGIKLKNWIEQNKSLLNKEAKNTSDHIKYLGAKIKVIGSYTFVRFSFDTDNAMGMNMATIASEAICKVITEKTRFECLSVAGNFDIDKKSAYLNLIDGKGYEVWAECLISEKVLEKTLHTDAKSIYDTWLAKCMIGSYASASMGYNCHFANIIAAIFIATGQDPAHVVEGSSGITTAEVRGKDLYLSVNIPSLSVGTVGGGTVLPTQKKCLEIMGIDKKTRPYKFAESIGGAVLAGELSLLASLTTRTLGSSHLKLGRRKIK